MCVFVSSVFHRQAMIELQRENENLKERLKVAVAQMVASVDTGEVEQRLKVASEEKALLGKENEGFNETLEKWSVEFREEHDGHEPTEEDR